MSYTVKIDQVVKKYGDFKAVDQVNLEVKSGELFTLLGPSGCGKTTLLRMIAGFNSIEDGAIYFDTKRINQVPAHKRDIGMVFQNYAIFPHMTVQENVAYGLKAKKIPQGEIAKKVERVLGLVQIEQLANRKPSELSGGQQQRVALARAIVIEPGILLMDEPLSNLDAKLRIQMRSTIRKLQKELGITTIYVTHDQEEALAISDKIAVMKDGHVMQVGTPEEIYKKPTNMFVAGFIGTSNFLQGEIGERDDHGAAYIQLANDFSLKVPIATQYVGKVKLSVRPGQLIFAEKGILGKVTFATFLGEYVNYEVQLETGECIEVHEYLKDAKGIYECGSKVHVSFNPSLVSVYRVDTQEVISC